MVLGVIAGAIAGTTIISDRTGSLRAATVGVFEISEEELSFLEKLEVFTVDPVSVNFEFISETDGAVGK